jgi:hypothetical protein
VYDIHLILGDNMNELITSHINEITFAVATMIGMIVHYGKKRVKAETDVSIAQWFGTANVYGSIASIGSAIAVIITALAGGIITEQMDFWSVVYVGFTTGFAVDSSTNSDSVGKIKK